MAQSLRSLAWEDETEYLPAVLSALAMPFTFSIAIGLGFIVHAAIKTLAGRAGEVHGAVWVLAVLSAVQFALSSDQGSERAKLTSASITACGCSGSRAWPASSITTRMARGPRAARTSASLGSGAIASWAAAT
ncbi:hypothetical protein C8P66_110148 [Humitalea rosea]|uniref:Uncharacterized protein n=1 Tax=Humitalea rosea TaxID=990373 RepID=A0A2W7IH59_9PROT|nr:hypothetical protein C8P66_110148 [Humitalea rosea]